jgi:hypothetical protein
MNANQFKWNVVGVIIVYALLIVIGILLRSCFHGEKSVVYGTFDDLVPLAIAIPAAWLAYCFERRQAYLKDVRDLWSRLIASTQEAIQYTHLENHTQPEFAKTLKSISITIEELRGVFSNIGERAAIPVLFPFESMKNIHNSISNLGFGEQANPEKASQARTEVIKNWKKLREHFLAECARGVPIKPDSPFLQ